MKRRHEATRVLSPWISWRSVLGTACVAWTLASGARAADWIATSNGNWHDTANWSGGVPNATASVATFTNDLTADLAVTLDSPATVGSMTIAYVGAPTPVFSSQQAVTVTTDSTNLIDLEAGDNAKFHPDFLNLYIQVRQAVAAAGNATVTFKLLTGDTEPPTTEIWSSAAIGKATLAANYVVVNVPVPATIRRYNRVTYTVATGPLTAGTFDASLTRTRYYRHVLSGSSTLTFDATGSGPADLVVSRGVTNENHLISTPVALTDSLRVTMQNGAKLTLSGGISGAARALQLSGTGTGTLRLESSNTFSGGISSLSASSQTVIEIAHDQALGTGNLHIQNGGQIRLNNAKGSELTLANGWRAWNNITHFTGGDFYLTGQIFVDNLGNTSWSETFTIASGVTVTLAEGIRFNKIAQTGTGTLKLMKPPADSGGRISSFQGKLMVYHDQAIGAGSVSWYDGTLFAADGARTLANDFRQYWEATAMNVDGTNNLTLNGKVSGTLVSNLERGMLRKKGSCVLTLNGNNTYADGTVIDDGVLVVGHTNALGTMRTSTSRVTVNSGATLAVAEGITIGPHATHGDAKYTWNSGSAIGGSGTFQRNAAWSLPANFTVRPGLGAATGTLTIEIAAAGALTFGDGRTLEVDFDGASADCLVLSGGGTLTLSGATDKLVLRGTPKTGSYVIASAASVSGTFNVTDTTGLAVTGGRVVYEADRVLYVLPLAGTVIAVR